MSLPTESVTSNSTSATTGNTSPRIIRSRRGTLTAAEWAAHSQPQPPTSSSSSLSALQSSQSEESLINPDEWVYLEVPIQNYSNKDTNTATNVTWNRSTSVETKLYRCQRKAATMSTLLADMLAQNDNLFGRTISGSPVLPLPSAHCSPYAIEQIIRWTEYHCDDPAANEPIQLVNRSVDLDYDEQPVDTSNTATSTASRNEIPCYWDRQYMQSIVGVHGLSAGGGASAEESRGNLYDLLIGAHFLGIDRLVELCAKFLCKQIVGKCCDEVRALLNVKNDFEPTEERHIHEDNAWISGGGGCSSGCSSGSACSGTSGPCNASSGN